MSQSLRGGRRERARETDYIDNQHFFVPRERTTDECLTTLCDRVGRFESELDLVVRLKMTEYERATQETGLDDERIRSYKRLSSTLRYRLSFADFEDG